MFLLSKQPAINGWANAGCISRSIHFIHCNMRVRLRESNIIKYLWKKIHPLRKSHMSTGGPLHDVILQSHEGICFPRVGRVHFHGTPKRVCCSRLTACNQGWQCEFRSLHILKYCGSSINFCRRQCRPIGLDTTQEFHNKLWIHVRSCTCVGIHPRRVEPASPIALTTSRTEALQTRRSLACSLDTFTQPFFHCVWPKTRGTEIVSRLALIVVAHVFSWPPARLRHVRGRVGRRRSLASSPSWRLAAWPNQWSLLCTRSAGMLKRQRRRRSSTHGTQPLRLKRKMRWMLSLPKTFSIRSSASRTGHGSHPRVKLSEQLPGRPCFLYSD